MSLISTWSTYSIKCDSWNVERSGSFNHAINPLADPKWIPSTMVNLLTSVERLHEIWINIARKKLWQFCEDLWQNCNNQHDFLSDWITCNRQYQWVKWNWPGLLYVGGCDCGFDLTVEQALRLRFKLILVCSVFALVLVKGHYFNKIVLTV